MDNAPYHNEQGPLHKTKKQDMKDWLFKYNIPFADDKVVPEIYQLMELHKPRLLRYLLDETAEK